MDYAGILKLLQGSEDTMDHLTAITQLKEKLSLAQENDMASFPLHDYITRLIQILGMPFIDDLQMDIKCK